MPLIFDAHVHLYPCYNLAKAMASLFDNLSNTVPDAQMAALLAERHDCHFFNDLKRDPETLLGPGFKVRRTPDENALVVSRRDGAEAYLFAGRQIVTAERIEILALISDRQVVDGQPATTATVEILNAGGIPVVSWAPGKWLFKRKQVVQELIKRFNPGEIVMGDSTLRPPVWPEPTLMKSAGRRGFATVAGSDPLPFPGEEVRLGTYATLAEGAIEQDNPVRSMQAILKAPGTRIRRVGRRSGTLETFKRLIGNARSKRQ